MRSALVIDSNFFGHSIFREEAIRTLTAHVRQEFTVHIPEVVVWELAEHAQAASERLRNELEVFKDLVRKDASFSAESVDGYVELIETTLRNLGVVVVRTELHHARMGLRSQVLQIDTGSRSKDGKVKTGAVDRIVAEVALELCKGYRRVGVASSDGGLRRFLQSSGVAHLEFVNGLADAKRWLLEGQAYDAVRPAVDLVLQYPEGLDTSDESESDPEEYWLEVAEGAIVEWLRSPDWVADVRPDERVVFDGEAVEGGVRGWQFNLSPTCDLQSLHLDEIRYDFDEDDGRLVYWISASVEGHVEATRWEVGDEGPVEVGSDVAPATVILELEIDLRLVEHDPDATVTVLETEVQIDRSELG